MDHESSHSATAVSLFSGLGGLDLGAYLAGIDTAVCVDHDPDAAKTLRMNSIAYDTPTPKFGAPQFDWQVREEDITDLDITEDIIRPGRPDTNLAREGIDLLIGGPPCQSFSRSNEGDRDGTQSELGKLYEAYESVLADLQPAGFVFENVVGILSSNNGDDIDAITNALSKPTNRNGSAADTNYNIEYFKLDASNYGVPQARRRVFILGVREGLGSPPTEADIEPPRHLDQYSDTGSALSEFDVDEDFNYGNAIRSKYAGFLKEIPPGANYQHFSERKYEDGEYTERTGDEKYLKEWDWRTRHWNYLLKQDPERPAWTLQAQPGSVVGPFHWRSRRFSFVEQMRLMTLPVWYEVAGDPNAIQRQIGNAVPPYLACAVIGTLADELGLNRTPQVYPEVTPQPLSEYESDVLAKPSLDQSPWKAARELAAHLNTTAEVTFEATREEITILIDVLELTRMWCRGPPTIELSESVGERPSPNQNRTYRHDTPAPSILTATLKGQRETIPRREEHSYEIPGSTD